MLTHLRFNERTQFFAKNYLQIWCLFFKKSIAHQIIMHITRFFVKIASSFLSEWHNLTRNCLVNE
jgi:hypothetical protein